MGRDTTNVAEMFRLAVNLGIDLVAADFALSAGFGTTASVAVAAGSLDQRGSITITSAGTGQGANPTVTLTYNKQWNAAPFVVVCRAGGSQPTVPFQVTTRTATSLVLTFLGTASAAETYQVSWIALG